MFQRKVYADLQQWKQVSKGKTAALIEGARRIGKSTVAEAFARAEYDDYLMIDFSLEGEAVRQIFREDIGNLDAFFRNLFLLIIRTQMCRHEHEDPCRHFHLSCHPFPGFLPAF